MALCQKTFGNTHSGEILPHVVVESFIIIEFGANFHPSFYEDVVSFKVCQADIRWLGQSPIDDRRYVSFVTDR